MRLALVLALIHGLVPGLGELAEAGVHYVVKGHLAHSDADHGDLGDVGDEHGCGGAQHLCGCCASQVVGEQGVSAPEEPAGFSPPPAPQPRPARTRKANCRYFVEL